jgi:fructose-1,6-bisphosphatase/inositol monophosphatase family enzyme
MSRNPMLNVAVNAVRKAGHFLTSVERQRLAHPLSLVQRHNLLSEVKETLTQMLVEHLSKAYPQHVLRVDGQTVSTTEVSETQWDIVPIDGEVNFLHGIPFYAVVLAVSVHGRPQKTVIFDPIHNDLFIADQGTGLLRNDKKQRVLSVRWDSTAGCVCLLESLTPTLLDTGGTALGNALTFWQEKMPISWHVRTLGAPHLAACLLAGGHAQGMCLEGEVLPPAIRLVLMESGASFLQLADFPVWCVSDGDSIEMLVKHLNRQKK